MNTGELEALVRRIVQETQGAVRPGRSCGKAIPCAHRRGSQRDTEQPAGDGQIGAEPTAEHPACEDVAGLGQHRLAHRDRDLLSVTLQDGAAVPAGQGKGALLQKADRGHRETDFQRGSAAAVLQKAGRE